MKLGNKKIYLTIFFLIYSSILFSEEKITTTPLINLNEIKPSFEESDELSVKSNLNENVRIKKKKNLNPNLSHALVIGLDKITAKSTELLINLNESKKFGPLEIKILKCGKIKINNKFDDVAYMQVKDLSKNDDEKVFIFNG